jgi:hypothetical protein
MCSLYDGEPKWPVWWLTWDWEVVQQKEIRPVHVVVISLVPSETPTPPLKNVHTTPCIAYPDNCCPAFTYGLLGSRCTCTHTLPMREPRLCESWYTMVVNYCSWNGVGCSLGIGGIKELNPFEKATKPPLPNSSRSPTTAKANWEGRQPDEEISTVRITAGVCKTVAFAFPYWSFTKWYLLDAS